MVEKPELHALYEYSTEPLTKKYEEMSPEERTRVHYCDMLIALCETVWFASKEKWLSEDEWSYWKRWAQDLYGSPYFRWALEWAKAGREYDKSFLSAIRDP